GAGAAPDRAATAILMIRVVRSLPLTFDRTAATFQIPVRISTPKAGQATWLNRRAAARGISAPRRRSTGTSAARVICPPTQTVAARMGRNSRIVSQLTASMAAPASSWRMHWPAAVSGHGGLFPGAISVRAGASQAGWSAGGDGEAGVAVHHAPLTPDRLAGQRQPREPGQQRGQGDL